MKLKDIHNSPTVNQKETEAEIISFFEALYINEGAGRFSPKEINWRPISSQHSSWLERLFKEAEIWYAIKSLGKNKYLGLMALPSNFFVKIQQQGKGDFVRLFAEFYRNGLINVCIKETFICLTPKEEVVERVKR